MDVSKRILWVDNLKGFLILLVVLGHCIQQINSAYQADLLFRYIYSFHMPLFIFVSGYVCYRETMQWNTIRKRFFQLIIPFLVWTGVSAISSCDAYVITDIILRPERGLWFLWALFFISTINIISTRIAYKLRTHEEIVNFIIAVGLFVGLRYVDIFCLPTIGKFYLFYVLGFYCRKYSSNLEGKEKKCVLVLLLAIFLILGYFSMQGAPPTFMSSNSNALYGKLYNTIVSLFAIAGFVVMFKKGFNKSSVLCKIGVETLGIYAIHRPIMSLLQLQWINTTPPSSFIYYIELALLWIFLSVLSYYAVLLLDKNKYTSFLFNGKLKEYE